MPKPKPRKKRSADKRRLRVEPVALGELREWAGNPKTHDLNAIIASYRRFGYVQPVVIDEASGFVVCGNGRIEALKELRADGEAPPEGIALKRGGHGAGRNRTPDKPSDWMVPALRGMRFKDDRERKAYAVADNRLTEVGGYATGTLVEVLRELEDNLDGVGFTGDDISELLKSVELPCDQDWAECFDAKASRSSVDNLRQITFTIPSEILERLIMHLRTFDKRNNAAIIKWLDSSS